MGIDLQAITYSVQRSCTNLVPRASHHSHVRTNMWRFLPRQTPTCITFITVRLGRALSNLTTIVGGMWSSSAKGSNHGRSCIQDTLLRLPARGDGRVAARYRLPISACQRLQLHWPEHLYHLHDEHSHGGPNIAPVGKEDRKDRIEER